MPFGSTQRTMALYLSTRDKIGPRQNKLAYPIPSKWVMKYLLCACSSTHVALYTNYVMLHPHDIFSPLPPYYILLLSIFKKRPIAGVETGLVTSVVLPPPLALSKSFLSGPARVCACTRIPFPCPIASFFSPTLGNLFN